MNDLREEQIQARANQTPEWVFNSSHLPANQHVQVWMLHDSWIRRLFNSKIWKEKKWHMWSYLTHQAFMTHIWYTVEEYGAHSQGGKKTPQFVHLLFIWSKMWWNSNSFKPMRWDLYNSTTECIKYQTSVFILSPNNMYWKDILIIRFIIKALTFFIVGAKTYNAKQYNDDWE